MYMNYARPKWTTKAITRHRSDEPSGPEPDKPDDWRRIRSRPSETDCQHRRLRFTDHFRALPADN